MLKIITSVVLSLVTIMAVTLFAVTVPAQSQKIEENETYIKTVDDALENLQEAFDVLDAKKTYQHNILITSTNLYITTIIVNNSNDIINTVDKYLLSIGATTDYSTLTLNASGAYAISGAQLYSIYAIIYQVGYPGATPTLKAYGHGINGSASWDISGATFKDTII